MLTHCISVPTFLCGIIVNLTLPLKQQVEPFLVVLVLDVSAAALTVFAASPNGVFLSELCQDPNLLEPGPPIQGYLPRFQGLVTEKFTHRW